jgi:DNA helicase II / ATP-dependent DNA helicase PcrA
VVLVEVSHASYPDDDASRHLLHIAATRAAHQLWVLTSDHPSPLLPPDLIERGY